MDFITITKEQQQELIKLSTEIEETTNEHFYVQKRAKKIIKILTK